MLEAVGLKGMQLHDTHRYSTFQRPSWSAEYDRSMG